MKCLVADDSRLSRRMLANALREAGFDQVIEAADGRELIQRCTADVDLILTDWNMPGMTGVELVRSVRARPAFARIPLLLLASRNAQEDLADAERAGANGCLLKPFTAETLRATIDELLGPGQATGTDG